VLALRVAPVLEIGIGSGFVSNYLKGKGIDVVTVDIDRHLEPDVCGSVMCLPFKNEAFKLVICYEVLEHLPYNEFPKSLAEIHRVTNSYVVLSMPDATQAYRFEFWVPGIGVLRGLLKLPWVHPRHTVDPDHHWEIGLPGYKAKKILTDIKKVGFELLRTYRPFEHPGHRFIVLKKG